LVERYHCLASSRLYGARIRYPVYSGNEVIAVLGFSAAAWQIEPRDRFIGWNQEIRRRNLQLATTPASSFYPGSSVRTWFPRSFRKQSKDCVMTGKKHIVTDRFYWRLLLMAKRLAALLTLHQTGSMSDLPRVRAGRVKAIYTYRAAEQGRIIYLLLAQRCCSVVVKTREPFPCLFPLFTFSSFIAAGSFFFAQV